MTDVPRVRGIRATACTIPTTTEGTPRPESDGTARWDATTILQIEIDAGDATGLGYSYTTPAALGLVRDVLGAVVIGTDPLAVSSTWRAMAAAVRNAGWPGIAATAISAVDIALHDLVAKLLDVSMLRWLGADRDRVMAYGSGGFTDLTDQQLQRQLGQWATEGYQAVKIKVGSDPDDDPRRAALARATIGDDVALFVDANGAHDVSGALAAAAEFEHSGVAWFEEPVSSDDLAGLARVRGRAPGGMRIAAGEYGYTPSYFARMLGAGAVDVLQADATRCGGVSGFRSAALQAWASGTPLSAHCAPALHATLGAAFPGVVHVEAFHDHLVIERQLFDGLPEVAEGSLVPHADSPGHGLVWRGADAARYIVAAWSSEDSASS